MGITERATTRVPSVLLLDDGELEDVRALVRDLGADVVHLRGGAIPPSPTPPRDLLVTTARRALVTQGWPLAGDASEQPLKLAVVTEDSNSLRAMLRRLGFDFLVRRPVHPVALRLLVERCLFSGEERRCHPRAAIGYEVTYRSGLARRSAVLADVSVRGLRLLAPRPLPLGTRVCVSIPAELAGGRGFPVSCRVVRAVQRSGPGGRREFWLALSVDETDRDANPHLAEVVRAFEAGPVKLAAPVGTPTVGREGVGSGEPEDRRRHPRAAYPRPVPAVEGPARVLVGRDLSQGGMRVGPEAGLESGKELRLALYGDPREEPLEVRARVARHDGAAGVALRFEDVSPETARRIERLVASLPCVELLREQEAGSVGTVISEVLPTQGVDQDPGPLP